MEEKKLTRKQRMQIRKRLVIKKKPSWIVLCITMAVLFAASILLKPVHFLTTGTYAKPGEDVVLTMTFAGDILLGRYIGEDAEENGYSKYYKNLKKYWKSADLSFCNLENSVLKKNGTYHEAKNDNSIYLSSSRSSVKTLFSNGLNMLALANNHISDYGPKPVEELCDYLDKYSDQVTYAGIGRTDKEACTYKVVEANGFKIGFVSVTEVFRRNGIAKPGRAGSLTTAYSQYTQIVNDASKASDLTVVYIHWGEENQTKANDDQRRMAHMLVNAGADIVIGTHPHVLQEAEMYKDGIIFYSLGNLIFDQGGTFNRDAAFIRYTLDKAGHGEFEVIPMRQYEGVPVETANPIYTTRINNELISGIDPANYLRNDNGHIVIKAVNFGAEDEAAENPSAEYYEEGED